MIELTPLYALLLFGAGLVAGFINVVAGGGSLLTLPALILLGLPTAVANGTNRVALVVQNLAAIAKFRREGFHDLKLGLKLSITAVLGAIVGAQLAISMPDELFKKLLVGVMILVLAAIVTKRRKAKKAESDERSAESDERSAESDERSAESDEPARDPSAAAEPLQHLRWQPLLMFGVGLWGGFVQAGVGYLLLFALSVVGGVNLVRANSLKVIIVLVYMVPSLAVFLVHGKVAWLPALVLTAGNGLGGWAGSAFSVKKGEGWIRLVLVVAMIAMAGKLLGLYG